MQNQLLAIVTDNESAVFASELAGALGAPKPAIISGTPLDAAKYLQTLLSPPLYVLIDIGNRTYDIFPELDALAMHCSPEARVVVIGAANDLNFYRQLMQKGVAEYFLRPPRVSDVKSVMLAKSTSGHGSGKRGSVISFISAASGDGSTTVAINTGYCLSKFFNHPTVIVDMDFQFGMVARNLDLTAPYGVRELFEHPEGSIDSILLERMLVNYADNLYVISAPAELRYFPEISLNTLDNLFSTLAEKFKYILIDLPHIWTPWVAGVIKQSEKCVMVNQLWLKSVTHSTRLLDCFRDVGISHEAVSMVINRSGSKFKEAISSKDFSRVSGKKIDFYLANDSKVVNMAENQGKTAVEISTSILGKQFKELASSLLNLN